VVGFTPRPFYLQGRRPDLLRRNKMWVNRIIYSEFCFKLEARNFESHTFGFVQNLWAVKAKDSRDEILDIHSRIQFVSLRINE
jgi:hypothetical protein